MPRMPLSLEGPRTRDVVRLGPVLHVQGGGEAILVGKTWRQGEFVAERSDVGESPERSGGTVRVFDFEVEGLHNFYVRGEGSDAAGVLVHNSSAPKSYVDMSTANANSAEAVADLKEYARRSNEIIDELGPQTVVSTKGSLRKAASKDARAERRRAAAAGTPYQGQAGHVPDTAVTGQAAPPGGYLDMRGNSNSIAGGCIGNCIGETIDGFTVDGQLP